MSAKESEKGPEFRPRLSAAKRRKGFLCGRETAAFVFTLRDILLMVRENLHAQQIRRGYEEKRGWMSKDKTRRDE